MKEQRSSGLERTFELGTVVVNSLVREPVKESVKEALAEERVAAKESTGKQVHVEDSTGSTTRPTGKRGKRRILRPRTLLPILGLAAAVAIARWRSRDITDVKDEIGIGDREATGPAGDGDTTTPPTSDGGTPTDPESSGTGTDDDGSEEDADQGETLHQ